jgi:hypothetical protein
VALTFDKFDAALGTLDAIEIRTTGTMKGETLAKFRDPYSFSDTWGYSAIIDPGVRFDAPGFDRDAILPDNVATCHGTPNPGSALCETHIGLKYQGRIQDPVDIAPLTQTVLSSSFGDWTGSGSVNLGVQLLGSVFSEEWDHDTNGYVDTRGHRIEASGQVKVTYRYSDPAVIPLPATGGLLGLALVGLGMFRRRRATG